MSTERNESSLIEIVICMGSSCFSRGNKRVLQVIREYLSANELNAGVVFRGAHCMGQCENGPVLQINGKQFHHVDPSSVSDILDDILLSLNRDQYANH